MSKFPLVPKTFVKVLAVVLLLVAIGFAIVIWIAGKISTTDVVGTLISAVIFAYLVHLYLIPGEDQPPDK